MSCLDGIVPSRGLAFIKHIATDDRYQGGNIIIPDSIRDNISRTQFIVVNVGNYERCEDEDCTRRHTKAGEHKHRLMQNDWVLARNRSWMQTPDPDIFVIWVSDILGVFEEGSNARDSADGGGAGSERLHT